MTIESSRPNIAAAALVCGLAFAIGRLLVSVEQPITIAWITVIGPSKVVALALLIAFGAWFARALRHGPRAIVVALPVSIVVGLSTPIEYLSIVLLGSGLWSATRRSAGAPLLIALGALGLHIALSGERLPGLLSLAMDIDTALAVVFIELFGGAVNVRGDVLAVDEGVSLRLIGPCSSIWPVLAMTGAVGSVAGAIGLGTVTRTYTSIALGALALMVINGLRLAIMGTSMGAYEWLHAGAGSTVFRVLILATIVVSLGFIVPCRKASLPSAPR